ncbi:MAG: 2-C-methyl-D-erythritol 4-phosphate cytidylyltransferase [Akkermansia sp.]|nr:2-C-methyl-D-erythritol 4-phosphate cytidylyltransferase [Akkermansia sp.]
MFAAVIVAAGSSRRAGFDKLAAPLAGVPVLRRSVEAFVAAGAAAVVVVCPESRWMETGLAEENFPIPVTRTDGGAERQDSVYAGLRALPDGMDFVAVHDGARPLVTPEGIRACLEAAAQTGAAACAHPVVDTLKRADAAGLSLSEPVSREHLWGMETPQIFHIALLREAYDTVRAQGLTVTDEVSAVETLGVPTRLVQVGPNLKITLPGDLELAELIWMHRA